MAEPHDVLNRMGEEEARAALRRCCGAARWVEAMLARRPYCSRAALLEAATSSWGTLTAADQREAFAHHPRIGEDVAALRARFGETERWASEEQAGVQQASEQMLVRLRELNQQYEARFGFVYLVCATGKSAAEMIALLQARLENDGARELAIAAGEQAKITRLRLEKLA